MPDAFDPSEPIEGLGYYRGDIYWNDFECIKDYINNNISGGRSDRWHNFLLQKYGIFDNSLIVNCGNGWVERELYSFGAIRSGVGFDISQQLIDIANTEARQNEMPLKYFTADANSLAQIPGNFDLVVNHGAMHHVSYIDRLTRLLYIILRKSSGLYVMMDYTGPHRNQYSWDMWSEALRTNYQLPDEYRKELDYPHLPTMLVTDPTEAVHSELQLTVLRRYFDIQDLTLCGGGVAYPLLMGNYRLFEDRHTEKGRDLLAFIIEQDRKLTLKIPSTNLFTFCVARPKVNALFDDRQLTEWQEEEAERELRAPAQGGRYDQPTALEMIYNRFYNTRDALVAATTGSK